MEFWHVFSCASWRASTQQHWVNTRRRAGRRARISLRGTVLPVDKVKEFEWPANNNLSAVRAWSFTCVICASSQRLGRDGATRLSTGQGMRTCLLLSTWKEKKTTPDWQSTATEINCVMSRLIGIFTAYTLRPRPIFVDFDNENKRQFHYSIEIDRVAI